MLICKLYYLLFSATNFCKEEVKDGKFVQKLDSHKVSPLYSKVVMVLTIYYLSFCSHYCNHLLLQSSPSTPSLSDETDLLQILQKFVPLQYILYISKSALHFTTYNKYTTLAQEHNKTLQINVCVWHFCSYPIIHHHSPKSLTTNT
jgi:hypothetical protein